MRSMSLAVACVALLACGGNAPSTVDGTWVSKGGMAGSSTSLTLTEVNITVSGNGTQSMEAGATRTFSVSGTYSSGTFSAVFTFADDGSRLHYQATVDGNTMNGMLTDGTSTALDFTKQ